MNIYGNTTVGTCSLCGGRVSVPTMWAGTVPPTPTCEGCGAVPAEPHGKVIPMRLPSTGGWSSQGGSGNLPSAGGGFP